MLLRVHVPKHVFDASTINIPALLYASEVLSERNALDLLSLAYRNRANVFDLVDRNNLLSDTQFDLAISVSTMLAKGLPLRAALARLQATEMRCPERSLLAKWQMVAA